MLRSVKSQIILATSLIIIVVLGAAAYLIIDQKTREINQDIYQKAVSFAELTHERVISNYESNYEQKAFAHFDREMADIYSLNEDITGLNILNYNGDKLYVDPALEDVPVDLERVQAIYPSVKTKEGRVVYLEQADNGVRPTNLNGRDVSPIGNKEQIENVIYPFRDQNNISRSFSINYAVNYDQLFKRVQETAVRIIMIAAAGILIALIIGYIVAGGITSPIRSLTDGAAKIGRGDLKTRIPVTSKSEVGMLAETFNKMAVDLEVSTKAMIEQEKTAKELEIAGKIQQDLLPTTLPVIENLDIAASLNAAEAVGGDNYDFITMQNGNLLFYIADVTGHGMGAGLVSAINNALVPAMMDHFDNTKDMMINLNKIIKLKTAPNIFVTSVMAIWEKDKARLMYTQAGHDPIMHYQAKTDSVRELEHGGMALGMIADFRPLAKIEEVATEIGDVFVLYTDGIPEAWRSETETFGMDRLKESVTKHCKLTSAKDIHDAILKDVRAYMGSYPQADDITLLVVKRTK